MRKVGAALHYTSPAAGNQRRMITVCNWNPVIAPQTTPFSLDLDNQV